MNKTKTNFPTHLPHGDLAFNSKTNELFVGMGDNEEVRKVVDLEVSQLVRNANVDYTGNNFSTIQEAMNSNVDYLLGEVNTLPYEGQHITVNSSMSGQAKSAILKGCTKFFSKTGGVFDTFVNSLLNELVIGKTINGANGIVTDKANEVLTVKFMPVPPTPFRLLGSKDWRKIALYDKEFNYIKTISFRTSEKIDVTSSDIENAIYCRLGYAGTEIDSTFRITDTNNANIPYPNLAIASVKMPVLTTIGKNLFDINGGIISDSTTLIQNNTITTKPKDSNVVFTIDNKNSMTFSYSITRRDNVVYNGAVLFKVLHDDGTETSIHEKVGTTTVSFSKPVRTIKLVNWCNGEFVIENIQLEQNTQATSFEPHKSNILTVNEEVELGSVGDVKDELNLLTGELTQRTREVAYSNDMKISLYTPKENSFYLIFGDKLTSAERLIIADKIPHTSNWGSFINNPNLSCYSLANTYLYITIPSVGTVDEAKQYLSNLNPIFRYVLATESVKTVVLKNVDQDGNETLYENGAPVYSYNEVTHYACGSEEGSVIPTISLQVPTNIQEVVSYQRETINSLEQENQQLKQGQQLLEVGHENQEEEIITTQDAVNFLLFDSLGLKSYTLEQDKEIDKMAVYIANQILKGKVTYEKAVSKYPQFKEDIDTILVFEGKEDLVQG